MSDWKAKAIKLAEKGDDSWRKIAEKLKQPKSTVSDHLRKHFHGYVRPDDFIEPLPEPMQDYWKKIEEAVNSRLSERVVPKVKTPNKKFKRKNQHIIIGDTQARDDISLSYMSAIGRYIADKQPEKIIHIGDHYDFPSLSSYDKGKRSFEGRRLVKDLAAGKLGLEMLMQPIYDLQDYQIKNGLEVYDPIMIVTLGNHEDRLTRLQNDLPELEGFLGDDPLKFEEHGWVVYPFLTPAYIDGIAYVHFMPNPMSGKPYGGSAMNILKQVGHSFVVGHKQTLDIAIRPIIGGKMQVGIVNGACYPHEEAYKGNTGNNHFRGITVLNEVEDGYGDPMFVSLKHLMERDS